MKLKEQILRYFFKRILARNEKFKGRHTGETCYIFGNGASLKNMELGAFSDHVSIGLNFLCLHNDYRSLNIQYHVLVESFFFYPYVRNPYTNQYQPNVLGNLFKKAFRQHHDITLFANISNAFGSRLFKKVFYLYHFGNRQVSRKASDISGAFSFMTSSLYAAIGLAINMGFKKAILVGCDYMFSPGRIGHFYTSESSIRTTGPENLYEKLFMECRSLIDLEVITDVGVSSWLPYQDYESLTGRKIRYRDNVEIVDPAYLKILNRAFDLKQQPGVIYPTRSPG